MGRLRGFLTIGATLGLFAGMLELAGHAVRRFGLHEFLFVGRDLLWTAPLVDGGLFVLLALVAWLASRLIPRLSPAVLAGFFLFLGAFGAFYIFPQFHRVAALILAAGLGVQAGRFAARLGEAELLRRTRRALPVLAGLVLLFFVGVRGGRWWSERAALRALGPAGRGAPNVLLIVLDTVRAFNLGLYGYPRNTMPMLGRFAEGGTTFDRAFSTAPWTLPSHASMFTGHWPHELGADWLVPLGPTPPTIAEALSAAGYYTAGVAANTNYVSAEVGLARGFVRFEDYVLTPGLLLRNSSLVRVVSRNRMLRRLVGNEDALGRKTAADINRSAERLLDTRPAGRPFFLFLNYYDAHRPYLPPAPYARMFVPDGTSPDPRLQRTAQPGDSARMEKTAWAENAYDGGLAWLDHELGQFLDDLARRGLLDSTVVIITSDHGEEFGEHGLFDHGNSLYRQAMQVPLVIRYPAGVPANHRVRTPVSTRELPATIVDLTGIAPARPFPGESLRRWLADSAAPDSLLGGVRKAIREPEFYPAAQGDLAVITDGGLRYIRNLGTGAERLYDFEQDPTERHDLIADSLAEPRLAGLRAMMNQIHFRR